MQTIFFHFFSAPQAEKFENHCSKSFIYALQFLTSFFSLKIGTSTLVCHSSDIVFQSSIRWQSSIITLIPISPRANIIFALNSEDPAAIHGCITFIAIAISFQVTFSMGPSIILASVMGSQSFSLFIISSM